MTHDGDGAAAGWYPDPHQPDRLRYFDGNMWTEHYHVEGRLPSVSSWLSSSFGIIGSHGVVAMIVAFGMGVVGSVLSMVALRIGFGDLALIDEEIVGLNGSSVAIGVILLLVGWIWTGITALVLNRYLQLAHQHAEPNLGEVFARSATRVPWFVGTQIAIGLVYLFAFLVIVAVAGGLAAIVHPAVGVLAGIFVGVPVFFWLLVKFAFVGSAVAAVPRGTSTFRASGEVSAGSRFWGVLGRLLLIWILAFVAGATITSFTGGLGSSVDQGAFNDTFLGANPATGVPDFRFADFLPTGTSLVVFVLLGGIIGAAQAVVTTSAVMRLYLDAGGPSEI